MKVESGAWTLPETRTGRPRRVPWTVAWMANQWFFPASSLVFAAAMSAHKFMSVVGSDMSVCESARKSNCWVSRSGMAVTPMRRGIEKSWATLRSSLVTNGLAMSPSSLGKGSRSSAWMLPGW